MPWLSYDRQSGPYLTAASDAQMRRRCTDGNPVMFPTRAEAKRVYVLKQWRGVHGGLTSDGKTLDS